MWSDVLVVTGTRTVMCLQCIKACDKLLYCTTVQHGCKDVMCCSWVLKSYLFDAHTHNRLRPLIRDNPGRPVPEETLTHSHPSWSLDILYHLPPFTTINGILFIHFTCLTVLSYDLFSGPLWSSCWSWTLNFILLTFLHPIVTFS